MEKILNRLIERLEQTPEEYWFLLKSENEFSFLLNSLRLFIDDKFVVYKDWVFEVHGDEIFFHKKDEESKIACLQVIKENDLKTHKVTQNNKIATRVCFNLF